MEEGSLLQEALEYMERMRNGRALEDDLQDDVLQLDVYDLEPQSDRISHLQRLAQLAFEFNNHIQQSDFLWHTGYPPVFGIHVTESIPHLRAVCRYGDNVGDEWMAIRCAMELSQKHPTVAIDCWDLDVGPILLIEGSDGLPDWLSEGQVDDSRYICWIVNGKVSLIGPTIEELTLQAALDSLRNDQMLSAPTKLQTELSKTIMNDSIRLRQRTALVVPRPVARLLQHAPELANTAAVAYTKSPSPVIQQHEDWVWTTCPLARTNYAMLRTISPKESPKMTAELKRIKRTCANEATPHLHHALEMGMRLTAGLDSLLKQKSEQVVNDPMSPMERRILQYWSGTDAECGGDGSWLQQAWQMGPNNSPYDMTHVMKCPVFKYEHVYPFPVSHPGVTMQEVIRAELNRKPSDGESFAIPRREDVDDEGWIHRGDEALEEAMAKRGPVARQERSGPSTFDASMEAPDGQQLDNMLGGFQHFMAGESEVEGIAHNESMKRDRPGTDEPLHINPRIFLNLMRDVLKSSPEELARNLNGVADDPFFSEEDYALMEPGVPLEDEADSCSSEEDMATIMEAMDAELKATAASRAMETTEQDIRDEAVADDARVLSNLMQSLGASEGAPGPVANMLKEMGVEPPKLRSDDMDESSDEG